MAFFGRFIQGAHTKNGSNVPTSLQLSIFYDRSIVTIEHVAVMTLQIKSHWSFFFCIPNPIWKICIYLRAVSFIDYLYLYLMFTIEMHKHPYATKIVLCHFPHPIRHKISFLLLWNCNTPLYLAALLPFVIVLICWPMPLRFYCHTGIPLMWWQRQCEGGGFPRGTFRPLVIEAPAESENVLCRKLPPPK